MRLKAKRPALHRMIGRDQEWPEIIRLGEAPSPWRDLYHRLLTLPWPWPMGRALVRSRMPDPVLFQRLVRVFQLKKHPIGALTLNPSPRAGEGL